jgi:hypothetical protein
VTQEQWVSETDIAEMLQFLRTKASIRKFRLFGVACCRRIERQILKTELGYRALVIGECLADGPPLNENLESLRTRLLDESRALNGDLDPYRRGGCEGGALANADQAVADLLEEEDAFLTHGPGSKYYSGDLLQVYRSAAWCAAHWQRCNDRDRFKPGELIREFAAQLPLLHDIFGNPSRPPVVIDLRCINWNSGGVREVAEYIYVERAFDRVPQLADALEDTGCNDSAIVGHFRGPGMHVRGCWALDLVLCKK